MQPVPTQPNQAKAINDGRGKHTVAGKQVFSSLARNLQVVVASHKTRGGLRCGKVAAWGTTSISQRRRRKTTTTTDSCFDCDEKTCSSPTHRQLYSLLWSPAAHSLVASPLFLLLYYYCWCSEKKSSRLPSYTATQHSAQICRCSRVMELGWIPLEQGTSIPPQPQLSKGFFGR